VQRIADRWRRQEDISDARPEFYDLQESELTAAVDLHTEDIITLNTTAATADLVTAVVERLRHAST
jgi:hypothetical protein